jgi:AraC-like DNA-binding protein
MRRKNKAKLVELARMEALAEKAGYCVKLVAQQLGMSPRSLQRYIKMVYGVAPKKIISRWRTTKIARLYSQRLDIEEIAHGTGFASKGNLCRSIKSATGKKLKELHFML